MKEITLLRHAKSSWEHATLDDFDRPLNERGLREGPMVAEKLRTTLSEPERILTSPAIRAYQTAQFCREAWGIGWSRFSIRAPIYEASAQNLFDLVRQIARKTDRFLLVGHNPGLSLLFDLLTNSGFDLKTATAVVLRFEEAQIEPGKGKLHRHLQP